jgi:hypothetical protein
VRWSVSELMISGRRNPGSWLTHGHWGKGRSGMWDRRESHTTRFRSRHARGYCETSVDRMRAGERKVSQIRRSLIHDIE